MKTSRKYSEKIKIAAAAALILALPLSIFGCAKTEGDGSYSERIAELEKERADLVEKREELCRESTPDAVIALCFDSISETVYSIASPMLSGRGFAATLVLTGSVLPGDDGMMSLDEMKSLLDSGWELALGDSGKKAENSEALAAYIDSRLAGIENLGLPRPTSFCFSKGCYDSSLDGILAEKGFNIIRHSGEDGLSISADAVTEPVWKIGSDYIHAGESSAQISVEAAIKSGSAVAVSTGNVDKSVTKVSSDCNAAKYESMLKSIDGYLTAGGVEVRTLSGARALRKSFDEDAAKNGGKAAEIAKIDAELAEIDVEIKNLMRKSMGN